MADGKNRKNELNTNKIINQYYNSEDGKQLKKRFQNAEDEDIGKALIVIGLIRSFISTESFYVSNGSVTQKELIKIQQKPNFQKFEVFLNQYNSLQGLRDSKRGFFSITEYNENKKEFFNRLLYLEKLTQKDISKLSLGFNNIVKLHKFFDNRRRDIEKSKIIPQDRSSKLIDERKLDKDSQIYEALSTMSSKITEGMLPEDVNIEESALKDIDLARKTVSNFLETNGVKDESKSINSNVSTTDEVPENELNNIGDIFESIGKENDRKNRKNKTTPEFYKSGKGGVSPETYKNIKDLARQTMSNINDIKKDINDIKYAENLLRYNLQQGNTRNDNVENKINEESGKFEESYQFLLGNQSNLADDEIKSINVIKESYKEWKDIKFQTLNEALEKIKELNGDIDVYVKFINEATRKGGKVNPEINNQHSRSANMRKMERPKSSEYVPSKPDSKMDINKRPYTASLKIIKEKPEEYPYDFEEYVEEIPKEIIYYEELGNELKELDERFKNLSNLYNGIGDKGSGDLSTLKKEFEEFATKYKEEIDNKMEDVNQKQNFDTYKGMLEWINQKSDDFDNWFDKIWRGKAENFETNKARLEREIEALNSRIQEDKKEEMQQQIEDLEKLGQEIDGENEKIDKKDGEKNNNRQNYQQQAEEVQKKYNNKLSELQNNVNDFELTINTNNVRENTRNVKTNNDNLNLSNNNNGKVNNQNPSNLSVRNDSKNSNIEQKNSKLSDTSLSISGGVKDVKQESDGKYNGTIVVTPKEVNDYYKKVCAQIKDEKEKPEEKQVVESIKNDLDKFADKNDKNNENGSIGTNVVKEFKDIIQNKISEELKNKLKEGGMTVDENGNIQIKSARQATQLWQSILDEETKKPSPNKFDEYQKVFIAMAYVCDDMVKSHKKANELKDISEKFNKFVASCQERKVQFESKEVKKPELTPEIKKEGVFPQEKRPKEPANAKANETEAKMVKWKKEIDGIKTLDGIQDFCNPDKDRENDKQEKNDLWKGHISPLVDGRVVEILKNEKNIEGNEKIKGSLDAIFYSRNAQGFDPKKICEEHRGTIEEIYNKAKSAQKGVEFSEKVNKDQQKVLPNTQPPGYWASKEDERKNQSGTSRYV
jgi:hypothetical protein